MNISLNWLSQYLDIEGLGVEEISDMLTFAGIEVEDIKQQGTDSPLVVVAQVKSAEPHPEADRLKVCMVDTGSGSLHQIVCGAKNYKVGDKVPCALPGAVLPGNFEIKVGKLRGVESHGMLCSASELGLVDKEDGLWILPEDLPLGKPVAEIVHSDILMEVEITPNRPDLLSHWGMARELSAITGRSLKKDPSLKVPTVDAGDFINLANTELCPFYTGIKVSGVQVKESPEWLKECLIAVGLRPINNIVDITNYVLMELGHPLHAYDSAKVNGGGLVIRKALDGEQFLALDGTSYLLTEEDAVVADQAGTPLCIGGVMGGEDSGVTESTKDLILESAWFQPSAIRKTSRRLGLSSDSSYRFERGTSPWSVLRAAGRALELILELAGGSASPAYVAGKPPRMYEELEGEDLTGVAFSEQGTDCSLTHLLHSVPLDWEELDQMTDFRITHEEAAAILIRLGLESPDNKGEWVIPPWRLDLGRSVDLLEEIIRVYGIDNISSRTQGVFAEESAVDKAYDYQMGLRYKLAGLGFYETQNIKLISSEPNADGTIAQVRDALPIKPLMDGDVIRVSLPLSEDHSVMRPAMTPGLISTAVRNVNHGVTGLRFFEMGRVFRNTGGGKGRDIEQDTLGILLSGDLAPGSWSNPNPESATFADMIAIIEALVPRSRVQMVPAKSRDNVAYGADIQIDGKSSGYFARLSLSRCRELGFNKPVFVAELDTRKLQEIATASFKVRDLPQYPGSSRDAAMELPIITSNAEIEKAIQSAKVKLLVHYACFDVFCDPSGTKLPQDRKSIAYSFYYRAADRTLKAQEVDDAHKSLLEHLTRQLNNLSFR